MLLSIFILIRISLLVWHRDCWFMNLGGSILPVWGRVTILLLGRTSRKHRLPILLWDSIFMRSRIDESRRSALLFVYSMVLQFMEFDEQVVGLLCSIIWQGLRLRLPFEFFRLRCSGWLLLEFVWLTWGNFPIFLIDLLPILVLHFLPDQQLFCMHFLLHSNQELFGACPFLHIVILLFRAYQLKLDWLLSFKGDQLGSWHWSCRQRWLLWRECLLWDRDWWQCCNLLLILWFKLLFLIVQFQEASCSNFSWVNQHQDVYIFRHIWLFNPICGVLDTSP